ncbi:hypothetical protein ACMA5I_01200 [Paracoccaceae bacterium GXU_MW_L88]
MNDLFAQLKDSARSFVIDNLPYNRRNPALRTQLSHMSTHELLVTWNNWEWRLIAKRPREVVVSPEFRSNRVLKERARDIISVVRDIELGNDLTKYLSRGVRHGYVDVSRKKTHQRRDLDLMLNDWGVHHLHISTVVQDDGFVERSDDIIFAIFRRDHVFLIDIMTHKDWAKEHIMRVIVRNWPEMDFVRKLKGVVGLSRSISDEERLALRKVQANTPTEIDGKVYAASEGMVTSGHSLRQSLRAHDMIESYQDFAKQYAYAPDEIIDNVRKHGVVWPNAPIFRAELGPNAFGVVETKTQTFFNLER